MITSQVYETSALFLLAWYLIPVFSLGALITWSCSPLGALITWSCLCCVFVTLLVPCGRARRSTICCFSWFLTRNCISSTAFHVSNLIVCCTLSSPTRGSCAAMCQHIPTRRSRSGEGSRGECSFPANQCRSLHIRSVRELAQGWPTRTSTYVRCVWSATCGCCFPRCERAQVSIGVERHRSTECSNVQYGEEFSDTQHRLLTPAYFGN